MRNNFVQFANGLDTFDLRAAIVGSMLAQKLIIRVIMLIFT